MFTLSKKRTVKKISILAATAIILLISSIAIAGTEKVADEIKDLGQAISEMSVDQKDKAVAGAKDLLDDLDDKIHVFQGRMEEKIDGMEDGSKDKYEKALASLKDKREKLSDLLAKMQDGSEDTWEEVKDGFSDGYQEMKESWEKIESDFQ